MIVTIAITMVAISSVVFERSDWFFATNNRESHLHPIRIPLRNPFVVNEIIWCSHRGRDFRYTTYVHALGQNGANGECVRARLREFLKGEMAQGLPVKK